MKNRNNVCTTALVAIAFAFAPIVEAAPRLDGGPIKLATSKSVNANSEAGAQLGMSKDMIPSVSISFAPIGLNLGQTARLNLVNVGEPNGITVSWRFIDANGLTLAQSTTTLTLGKLESVDYRRRPDPLPGQDEPARQLRAEVRAEVTIVTRGVPSESLRRSLEVFDNDTGATTVFMGGGGS